MELRGLRHLMTLLLVLLAGIPSKGNDTVTEEIREPKSNRRVVKLYSGTRPEPFVCADEGFHADLSNCAVFYRCMKAGRGKYIAFRFQCAPGTVYDPDSEVCNHPQNTKRIQCGGVVLSTTESTIENEIINRLHQEIPSPISTKQPLYTKETKTTTISHISGSPRLEILNVSTKYPWPLSTKEKNIYSSTVADTRITSTKRQSAQSNKSSHTERHRETSTAYPWSTTKSYRITRPFNRQSTSQNNDICNSDGFVGDSENCRKFYRCVNNQRGGFIRYEFLCSETTIWDDDIQSCNHAWAVKRRRCGRGSSNKIFGTENKTHFILNEEPEVDEQNTIKNTEIVTEINLVNQNQSLAMTPLLPQNNKVNMVTQKYDTNISKLQITTSSSLNNNEYDDDQGYNTLTTKPASEQASYVCTESGFIGDHNDCTKFYRCIDNGKGSYLKYEFSCGEGTVWDPKIESCNHAWAVDECGIKEASEPVTQSTVYTNSVNNMKSTTKQTTASKSTTIQATNQHSVTNMESTENEIDDEGYGNHSQEPIFSSSSTSISSSTLTTTVSNSEGNNCVTSGFKGDKNDCKKFYRCVDDGHGGYTRYEFTCGEGTVWDSKIEACNHAWAVTQCGGNNIDKIETTTSRELTTSMSNIFSTSSTQHQTDTGYGSQHNDPITSTSSSTTISISSKKPDSNVNKCSSSGFIGDRNDCQKFYRCVDDGNGGFTRYEFSCGEGTVWDSKIEACNHAWAVEKCGNVLEMTENPKPDNNEEINNTYPIYNDDEIIKTTENVQYTTTTITNEPPLSNNNMCMKEGFYGDNNDCRKFHRCVNNQRGGFIRYEFTCGEGTVWDSETNSCNHAESVKSPCKSNVISGNVETTSEIMTTENGDKQENLTTIQQQTSTTKKPSSFKVCSQEGFIGDENDCKKFYRCVDDGRGGYLKYEFTCGEGTVWDNEIQSCNHESPGNRCPGNNESNIPDNSSMETENNIIESTSMSTTSHVTDNTEQTSLSDTSDDVCKSEGFYGNSKNCKKFYRCVDNGNGGYNKYEFSCGDGTIWVQEIQACDHEDHIQNCSSINKETTTSTKPHTVEEGDSVTTKPTTTSSKPNKQDDEYNADNTTTSSEICTSEGFYSNKNDCKYFYRCVDNGKGGYTRYDFKCGEGTAWDSDLQTCNHINEVKSCDNINQDIFNGNKPMMDEEQVQTTGSTSTTNDIQTSTTSKPINNDKCEKEGYYGNRQDCSKFYRCVDNGKGGYTKYDYSCGEGTIWDQDLLTCNHPQDVSNRSCEEKENNSLTTTDSSNSMTSTTSSLQTTTHNSMSSQQDNSNCTQENSTKAPEKQNIKCEKAGFYAYPNDCKKFYRCVDWDGNGQRFSVYHFDCGEGTIWDPQLETCNHEESVYPPRDCSGVQPQNEVNGESTTSKEDETSTNEMTTRETMSTSGIETTTDQSTTTEGTTTTTTEQTTSQETTEKTTSQQTTEQTTSQQTTEQTTSQQTSEQTTSQQTTEQTTSQPSTTTEQTTTSEKTTQKSTEQTTEYSTTNEQNTTEETTDKSTTSDQTTSQQSTSEQTTTEETTTTEQSSHLTTNTEESTTQQSTTTESMDSGTTTEDSTTEQEDTTTDSEQQSSTTESSTSTTQTDESSTTEETSNSSSECPETDEDQYLYVCPTSFKRHPKYCNMFYQCTEDDDSHEPKIAVFTCPNNTIYDESKVQCVEEEKTDDKCNGEIAQRRRFKRLNVYYKEPIVASRGTFSCPGMGYYPFESNVECSPAFLKCQKIKSGKIRGYVHQCPEGYYYWSISKRCEKKTNLKDCKLSSNDWNGRWQIPYERRNIAT